MTKIQILVGAHYAFYKETDILSYVGELLEKNKFLYNDIENMSN